MDGEPGAQDGQIESLSWNPTTGCDRVSPGCDRCYALSFAQRLQAMGNPRYRRDGDPRTSGPGFGVSLHPDALDKPRHWRKPRLVFTDSMSDLFHPRIPEQFIERVVEVMRAEARHVFFVLTKRPVRMTHVLARCAPDPLPNVWWGVTVENEQHTDRVETLRATPAAVRFVSLQPLLGPLPSLEMSGLDWVYAGGESGPGARAMHPDWVRDIRDRCLSAGVPFLFKQWGGPTRNAGGRTLDGVTWDQMPPLPDDLRTGTAARGADGLSPGTPPGRTG
jgi:protein gp37